MLRGDPHAPRGEGEQQGDGRGCQGGADGGVPGHSGHEWIMLNNIELGSIWKEDWEKGDDWKKKIWLKDNIEKFSQISEISEISEISAIF